LAVLVGRARDTNIARTFLHDDCKDNSFLDGDLSRFIDGVEDASDTFMVESSLEYLMHVDMKERDEVFPCVLAGKGRRQTGEKLASYHKWKVIWVSFFPPHHSIGLNAFRQEISVLLCYNSSSGSLCSAIFRPRRYASKSSI
jgi:hypothetical protein